VGCTAGVFQPPAPVTSPFWAKPVNPRWLVCGDDGCVSSCTCPCPAALDGIPGRVPGDHRLGPLRGLMASRYPGADAFTPASGGWGSHPHEEEVTQDQSAPAGRDRSLPGRTNRTEPAAYGEWPEPLRSHPSHSGQTAIHSHGDDGPPNPLPGMSAGRRVGGPSRSGRARPEPDGALPQALPGWRRGGHRPAAVGGP
jgi:hypothetical protein